MSARLRHCVECPNCRTRYLIAFSPYRNGAYLVPTVTGSLEDYTLYCSCERSRVATRRRWNEVRTYEVSKAAHDRGYGTPEEIVAMSNHPTAVSRFDVTSYLNLKSIEKGRNSA